MRFRPFSGIESSNGARRGSRRSGLRIIAAALVLDAILTGFSPALAQPKASTPAGAASPADAPIGLPRVTDYAPTPELRDIFFDSGKDTIRPGDEHILAENAAWLRDHPDHLLLIEGHSDSRGAGDGKNQWNLDLGERRAQAAMNHLVALGIHPKRITTLSYGEERPQCTEENQRCWSRNRRSRFLVKPP